MNQITIKKISAGIISAAMLLAGCSGGSDTADPTDTALSSNAPAAETPANNMELTFTWWGDTRRNEIYEAVCDTFEAATPGVTIIREPSIFTEYWDKLSTRIAGGNAPEIMGIHANFGSDLGTRGVLADLQPYVDSGAFDTSKMSPDLIASSKIAGKFCVIPQGVTIEGMYINQSLLDEVGYDLEALIGDYKNYNAVFTYETFEQAAKEFTEMARAKGLNDVYFGAPGPANNVAALQYWSRTTLKGIDLYKDEGGLGITQDAIEKWFDLHKRFVDNGWTTDAATNLENASAPLEDQLFTRGKVVVQTTSANQYSQYHAQMADKELYLTPFPGNVDGSSYNALVASHFAVSNQTDDAKKEMSARFLSHFFNDLEAVKIFKLEQGVPINQQNADAIAAELDADSAFVIKFVNTWSEKGARFWVYPPAGANEFAQLLDSHSQTVMFGQTPPADAAAALYSEGTASF